MSPKTHHVFLVPGFLGIESLGEVMYFAHVRGVLTQRFAELGLDTQIHAVGNYATSSIRKRTLRLLSVVRELAGAGDGPVHLIGHSTGGLDARLLVTPGANLGCVQELEAIATRVRSIVCVASPHRGTPLASFFTTRMGGQLLQVLSLGTSYMLRFGRLPISVVVRIAALFVRMHAKLGVLSHTIAEHVFSQLLGDLSVERRDELNALFADMAGDVALMPQLMPESMDMFDAAVGERDGVRCACVVAAAKPGLWRNTLQVGLDPYAQATHALFEALARLTSELDERYVQRLDPGQIAQLRRSLEREPTASDNDGIVPVLSQLWGELIHVAQADHFDVIGHFADARRDTRDTPHYDWLASGSGFDRRAFDALWNDVARFIAAA